MRAFLRLRELLESNAELGHKLAELEKKYDRQFKIVFDSIRQLMTPRNSKRKQIRLPPECSKEVAGSSTHQ